MRLNARALWKLVGLAGVVGVAATGAFAVQSERKRRAYTPDEVRSRLHARFAQATTAADRPRVDLTPVKPTLAQRLSQLIRRGR
ncbi:hypothetical protein FK531_17110 [Rhodococcus spelaei]|uniref:Uncharacterized protein n=1 Tax=Rhodococcus spelaei TaxID=2546320 RepID=A0A541B1R5_9NOCA|nr:hypothetical protein [Rhodococcus spelaei]TQF66248.1 hypothetical protein FK531_17110 [Rhodococcus spelaei]